jgi:hypothetical protein
LGKAEASLNIALGDALLLGGVVAGVSLFALLGVVSALALPARTSTTTVLNSTIATLKGQLTLSAVFWMFLAVWCLAALLLLTLVGMVLGSLCSEPVAEMAVLGAGLVLVTGSALLQPWLDLARASHAGGERVVDAATTAFVELWRRPVRTAGSWLAMTALGLLCVGLAVWWSVGHEPLRNASSPWLALLVQQAAFGALTLCRVAWLADAAELMQPRDTAALGDADRVL